VTGPTVSSCKSEERLCAAPNQGDLWFREGMYAYICARSFSSWMLALVSKVMHVMRKMREAVGLLTNKGVLTDG